MSRDRYPKEISIPFSTKVLPTNLFSIPRFISTECQALLPQSDHELAIVETLKNCADDPFLYEFDMAFKGETSLKMCIVKYFYENDFRNSFNEAIDDQKLAELDKKSPKSSSNSYFRYKEQQKIFNEDKIITGRSQFYAALATSIDLEIGGALWRFWDGNLNIYQPINGVDTENTKHCVKKLEQEHSKWKTSPIQSVSQGLRKIFTMTEDMFFREKDRVIHTMMMQGSHMDPEIKELLFRSIPLLDKPIPESTHDYHNSECLVAIKHTISELWSGQKPPKKEVVLTWLREHYPELSDRERSAIDSVIRPQNLKGKR